MDKAFDAVLQSEVDAAVIAKTSYCFLGSDFVTNACVVVKKFILPLLIVANALIILDIEKEIMIRNVNDILDSWTQWNILRF